MQPDITVRGRVPINTYIIIVLIWSPAWMLDIFWGSYIRTNYLITNGINLEFNTENKAPPHRNVCMKHTNELILWTTHNALRRNLTSTFRRIHMEYVFESLKHTKQDISIFKFKNQVWNLLHKLLVLIGEL